MPITPARKRLYPADWPRIARAAKDAAGWRCLACSNPATGRELGAMQQHEGAPALPGYFKTATASQAKRKRVAGKPVELLREILRLCPRGGHVLDPFSGTGTTLEAAHQLGLRATGIEVSEDACDDIRSRLGEIARQRTMFCGPEAEGESSAEAC